MDFDQKELEQWKLVDVGGFAAYGTLFAFTLETIKDKVEEGKTEITEEQDRIRSSLKNMVDRFNQIDPKVLDRQKFPVDTLGSLKSRILPEMSTKYKELDTLLKHFISGAAHLKVRIVNKVKECKDLVKEMNNLGIEFSRSDRYWEYRQTKPERVYLDDNFKKPPA